MELINFHISSSFGFCSAAAVSLGATLFLLADPSEELDEDEPDELDDDEDDDDELDEPDELDELLPDELDEPVDDPEDLLFGASFFSGDLNIAKVA